LTALTEYYDNQLAEFKKDPDPARKTLNVGEYPQTTNTDPTATAALMRVIDTLYNLEEAITKT
jgi:hypothetical protein